MPAFKFRIKSNSTSSITQQVADQIREAIKSGRIKAGERLPSEMEIAEQLGMSRGVGKKAYAKLKGQGLFVNGQVGRIVASSKGKKATDQDKKSEQTKAGKKVTFASTVEKGAVTAKKSSAREQSSARKSKR